MKDDTRLEPENSFVRFARVAARVFDNAALQLELIALQTNLAFTHNPFKRLWLRFKIATLKPVIEGRWLRRPCEF